MRLRTASALGSIAMSAGLLVDCDDPAAEASQSTASTPVSSAGDESDPECDSECRAERRADRQARESERCDRLLSRVRLRYRITATPAGGSTSWGLRMTLVNRSTSRLAGSTVGLMKIDPEPRRNRISWGGSSADEIYQRAGSTTRREVWHDRQPPGWHPVGERVSSLAFILLPLGIPLLSVARRLMGRAVRLMLPPAVAHPVRESKRGIRSRSKALGGAASDTVSAGAKRGWRGRKKVGATVEKVSRRTRRRKSKGLLRRR